MDRRLADFIAEHSGDDPVRLLLSRGRWPDIDMDVAATAVECRKKIARKLPEWYAEPGIIYPDRICAEQASSSETAKYKVKVAGRIILAADGKALKGQENAETGRIADLTGGLGVDSIAFSRVAEQVLYNEMEAGRAEAAAHNFHLLGADGIRVVSHRVAPSDSADICAPECPDGVSPPSSDNIWHILREFGPDLIYIDPARRSETGRKVFLIEDCSPDVTALIPDLFKVTGNLLLKLSPMADIRMLVKRLHSHGAKTNEVHVVASGGECKELLLWLVPEHGESHDTAAEYRIVVCENGHILSSDPDSERRAAPLYLSGEQQFMQMPVLYVPGRALAKAGLFNTICTLDLESPLYRAGVSTHLYFSMSIPQAAADFGKCFEIIDVQRLDRNSIRRFSERYRGSEVTAMNIPMTSGELRARLRATGGDVHIFAFRADFISGKQANYMIACRRAAPIPPHASVK